MSVLLTFIESAHSIIVKLTREPRPTVHLLKALPLSLHRLITGNGAMTAVA